MKKILGFIVLSMAFTACYKDKEQLLYPNDFNAVDTTNITYSADIQPLIANRCATTGCHATGGQSPTLNTYALLSANIVRVKARAIDKIPSPMPAAGLSSNDLTKLRVWINSGAKNN